MSTALLVGRELSQREKLNLRCAQSLTGNDGRRIFPMAKIVQTVRYNGEIHALIAEYPDGSQLHFRWEPNEGCATYESVD